MDKDTSNRSERGPSVSYAKASNTIQYDREDANLAADIELISKRLLDLSGKIDLDDFKEQDLHTKSLSLYRSRRECADILRDLSAASNGSFDILLDLYYHSGQGVKVSITSAVISSGLPASTALRCVHQLAAEGLTRETPDPDDRRRVFVELTPRGVELVERCLRAY